MSKSTDIAEHRPNPQGKAAISLLQDWVASRPENVQAKTVERLFADYYTSMLVLSANLRIKPIVGKHYYFYLRNEHWELSLIGPLEWGHRENTHFIGVCTMHEDRTWSLDVDIAISPVAVAALSTTCEAFSASLARADSFEAALPTYKTHMSYHSRMQASAVALSVKLAAQRGITQGLISAASVDDIPRTDTLALPFSK